MTTAEAAASTEEFEETANFAEGKYELRSIREITADLSKPVAKRHLRLRKQGGKEIKYLAWHDAIKYLDHYASGWNYEIRSIDSVGGKLILTVRLSVPCA